MTFATTWEHAHKWFVKSMKIEITLPSSHTRSYSWQPEEKEGRRLSWGLPPGTAIPWWGIALASSPSCKLHCCVHLLPVSLARWWWLCPGQGWKGRWRTGLLSLLCWLSYTSGTAHIRYCTAHIRYCTHWVLHTSGTAHNIRVMLIFANHGNKKD